jgi:hypothetical protein
MTKHAAFHPCHDDVEKLLTMTSLPWWSPLTHDILILDKESSDGMTTADTERGGRLSLHGSNSQGMKLHFLTSQCITIQVLAMSEIYHG